MHRVTTHNMGLARTSLRGHLQTGSKEERSRRGTLPCGQPPGPSGWPRVARPVRVGTSAGDPDWDRALLVEGNTLSISGSEQGNFPEKFEVSRLK